jgi:2-C-methyl-D-erythritol 4-phosphate cytidylyltransferase
MTRLGRAPSRLGTVAVVPAGGMGSRMKGRRPKQYLGLAGLPLLIHALRALLSSKLIDGLVLAVPADRVAATRILIQRHRVPRVLEVLAGGSERQESVWRALHAVPENTQWIVVHDAVRPFIHGDLVGRVLRAARRHGAATCGLPVRESVKRVSGKTVASSLDREGLWLIQTPQAFSRALLWEAHDKARRDGFLGTDDAVLIERLGGRVVVVPGLSQNLKVTTPEDLRIARLWVSSGRARALS